MTKADVCRQYRDKYGLEMPTKKLARIVYKENTIMFNDVEDARMILRRIEGKVGIKNNKPHTRVSHPVGERPLNPYRLPESDEKEFFPYILNGFKNVGLLSDIHVPYHSVSALTAAIDSFIQHGIDCLLLNGDVLDFYGLSRFQKDPRKRSFGEELEVFTDLINSLRDALNCPIIFKLGNHELRYDSFLLQKAHELVGVPEFNLETVIKNRIGDVEIIPDKQIIQANGLDIIHGHEFAQSIFSPVNIARGLALRAKTNAIQGHNHTTSEHTESNLRGEIRTTWSLGCNCELHPDFMPINKWNHGFGRVELSDNSDDFRVFNYRVIKGRVV